MIGPREAQRVAAPSRSEVEAQIHYRLMEQLSASERRYRVLVENLRDPVFQSLGSGRLKFANAAFRALFEPPEVALEDTNLLDLAHPQEVTMLARSLQATAHAKDGDGVNGQVRVRTRSGDYIHVAFALRKSTAGDIVGSFHNLTEQKEVEKNLKRAKEEAEAASRVKSAFLANMSHEIRTPLSAVLGFADLLARDDLTPEERRDCLQRVVRNGEHLLALVDDILDFSKVESGRLELSDEEFAPCELVDDLLATFRKSALEKGIELNVVWQGDAPPQPLLVSDPVRLKQVLSNLLANAVKFTSQGTVVLDVTTNVPEGRIRFTVADSGIGIAEEHLESIFEPFQQADAAATRAYGGTGLGLAISRRLARLLGGELLVESQPGKGSRFRLDLPLRTAAVTAPSVPVVGEPTLVEEPKARVRQGCRVLLVEDTSDLATLMARRLENMGVEVDLASNGEEAVEAVGRAMRSGTAYGAVLMDMQMPVMDGYAATRALRSKGYDGLVVALTAHAMRGDREKCVEAGCDDYLPKPVRQADLEALFLAHCADRKAAVAP